MSLIRVSEPTVLPISLIEAKAIARLEDADGTEDALVMAYLRAATSAVEQQLGRALITSTWRYAIDCFPCRWNEAISIPLAPVQTVTEISYLDVVGVVQILDPTVYVVSGGDDAGRISLAHDGVWPATRRQAEAITIDFIAGYDGWNAVPEQIRMAVGEQVRGLYDGCHSGAVDELLSPYQVRWF
jgi:uncharacterized phiE125 gp8 family phage protein